MFVQTVKNRLDLLEDWSKENVRLLQNLIAEHILRNIVAQLMIRSRKWFVVVRNVTGSSPFLIPFIK